LRRTTSPLVAPWLGDEGQLAFYRQIAAYDERYLAENRRTREPSVPPRRADRQAYRLFMVVSTAMGNR
jgi:hypothetical protein